MRGRSPTGTARRAACLFRRPAGSPGPSMQPKSLKTPGGSHREAARRPPASRRLHTVRRAPRPSRRDRTERRRLRRNETPAADRGGPAPRALTRPERETPAPARGTAPKSARRPPLRARRPGRCPPSPRGAAHRPEPQARPPRAGSTGQARRCGPAGREAPRRGRSCFAPAGGTHPAGPALTISASRSGTSRRPHTPRGPTRAPLRAGEPRPLPPRNTYLDGDLPQA